MLGMMGDDHDLRIPTDVVNKANRFSAMAVRT